MKPSLLKHKPSRATIQRIIADGARADATRPRAVRARFDADADQIIIELRGGYGLTIQRRALRGPLRTANAKALEHVRIEGAGSVLFWPELDDGFDVTEILAALLGPQAAAATLGRRGGAARNPAKAVAARANGQRGGRPARKTRANERKSVTGA